MPKPPAFAKQAAPTAPAAKKSGKAPPFASKGKAKAVPAKKSAKLAKLVAPPPAAPSPMQALGNKSVAKGFANGGMVKGKKC